MKEHLLAINPELIIETYADGVQETNMDGFLDGADYVIDAIDYFEFPKSVQLHRAARAAGLHVTTAVALGFGASVLTFAPDGVNLETYLGIPEDVPVSRLQDLVFPAGNYASSLPAYATAERIHGWLSSKTIPTISVGQALGPGILVSQLVLHLLQRKKPTVVPDKYEIQFEL